LTSIIFSLAFVVALVLSPLNLKEFNPTEGDSQSSPVPSFLGPVVDFFYLLLQRFFFFYSDPPSVLIVLFLVEIQPAVFVTPSLKMPETFPDISRILLERTGLLVNPVVSVSSQVQQKPCSLLLNPSPAKKDLFPLPPEFLNLHFFSPGSCSLLFFLLLLCSS